MAEKSARYGITPITFVLGNPPDPRPTLTEHRLYLQDQADQPASR